MEKRGDVRVEYHGAVFSLIMHHYVCLEYVKMADKRLYALALTRAHLNEVTQRNRHGSEVNGLPSIFHRRDVAGECSGSIQEHHRSHTLHSCIRQSSNHPRDVDMPGHHQRHSHRPRNKQLAMLEEFDCKVWAASLRFLIGPDSQNIRDWSDSLWQALVHDLLASGRSEPAPAKHIEETQISELLQADREQCKPGYMFHHTAEAYLDSILGAMAPLLDETQGHMLRLTLNMSGAFDDEAEDKNSPGPTHPGAGASQV